MKRSSTSYMQKISITIFVIGIVWILFFEKFLATLSDIQNELSTIQVMEMGFFIITNLFLFYFLLKSIRESHRETEYSPLDIFNFAKVGIFQLSPDGIFIKVNPIMASLLGYTSPEEMLEANKDLSRHTYISIEDRIQFINLLNEYGVVEKFETENFKKDGSIIWTSTNGRAVKGEKGKVLYYEGFVTDITEQKNVQHAFRDTEKKYHTLIEQLPVAAYIDSENSFASFFSNQQILAISGYTAEEWKDDPNLWMRIIHPEDKQRIQEEHEKALKSGETFNTEYRLITKNGTVVWVHDIASLIMQDNSGPSYWQGILVDVTKQKLIEEQIITNEAQYHMVVEQASDGILIASSSGKIYEANQQICDLLGFTKSEILNFNLDDIFANNEMELWESDKISRNHAVMIEKSLRRKDGTFVLVELSLKQLPNNLLIGIARNISNRKLMEESIARSEKKFRALIENSMDGVALYSAEGRILFLSPAASRIFGYPPSELLGKKYLDVVYETDKKKAQDEIHKIISLPNESVSFTVQCVCKDGSLRWIEFNCTNHLSEPHIEAIISNFRDITERKVFENTLFDAEERYRLLVENLPAVIFMDRFNDSQTSQYMSPRIKDLLGYTADEWKNGNGLWESSLHPDDRERVIKEDIRTDTTGESFHIEYRMRHRDGHYVWIKEDSSIIKGEDGTPLFWQGVLLDITEQKRTEAALKQRDAILKTVGFSAEEFLKTSDWETSINSMLAMLGKVTSISRISIFKKEAGKEVTVSQTHQWRDTEITPQIQNQALQDINLLTEGYERWVDSFNMDKPIFGNVKDFSPEEQNGLDSQGIISIICIPIQVGVDWWGFIRFDDCINEHIWSDVEIEALRAAANTLGTSIERKMSEETLLNSEISYRGLFNTVQDAIYIQDKNGNFLDVNEGAVKIYGYPKEEFLGKTPEFLSAPGKNNPQNIAQAIQLAFEGIPQQFEFWGLRSNGEIFPKDVRLFKGTYFGKEVIIAVSQDITARKKDEEALQKQFKELSILHQVALAESTARDSDQLIQQITDIIKDALYLDNCGVFLFNEAQGSLIPHFSYQGADTEKMPVRIPINIGIGGKVATSKRSILVADVLREPEYFEISSRTRSELCAPIMSGSTLFGVLNVESQKPDTFTERDERLLNTIAGGLANALERIKLFELEQRRRSEAENLQLATASLTNTLDMGNLLESILDWLKVLAPYDSASIMIKKGDKLYLAGKRDLPDEYKIGNIFSITEKWNNVALIRKPLVVYDVQLDDRFEKWKNTEYIRGWMSVAMFTQDELIGFINLDSRTPGAYNEENASLIQTFANQAATAIEKAKLFDREKKRRQSVEALMNAATELNNLLDLPSLQNAILEWLQKIAPYDSASILEIEGNQIRITATKNLPNPEKILNQTFPADNILCKTINETGQALIIEDCQQDTRFEKWGDTNHIRGWMGVPLISRGQVIGYLTVDSSSAGAFSQDDAITAQTFAHQAATALENTRLYSETRKRLEELEMVNRVSFTLRTAKDAKEMLPILLGEIKTSVDTDTAAIWLYDSETKELIPQAISGWLINLPKPKFKTNEGIIGRVFTNGLPHLSNKMADDPLSSTENKHFFQTNWSTLAVPIRTSLDTIGVIMIARKHPQKIESHHIRLLTTLADIAGNAIYRSNLFQQSEGQIRRLTTLREIDTAITSSLDLNITLNILTEHLTTKMGVSAARVLIYNPNSQMLDSSTTAGFYDLSLSKQSIGIGNDLASQTLLSRKELLIENIEEENGILLPEYFIHEGFKSYVAIPLFSKGSTKGVLETFFRSLFTPTTDWKDFLKTLAGQATIAIDNAQLFQNLQQSNQELSLAYDTTLEGWGKALELRDKETKGHTNRVANLTLELARQMGIPESEITHIRRGTLLHDIGKMGVPDNILRKPGPLTKEEMNEMRKHPQYAYDLLSPIAYLRPTLDIAYCHHEWWDGSGYPRNLKGEEIPLPARIFAIVDVWDALLSDRPYRKSWEEADVIKYITDLSGKQFDPHVVTEFLKLVGAKPPPVVQTTHPKKTHTAKKKPATKTKKKP